MPLSKAQLQGHGAMLAFSMLIAGSFAFGARTANVIAPEVITTLRFVLAAALLLAAAKIQGTLTAKTFQAPWRYFLLGGAMAAYFVAMFEGLKTASALATGAIFTLMPLMTAALGWLILRQKITARVGFALLIGGIGALFVIFNGDLSALARFELGRGEWIYLAGSVLHALYAVLVPKLNRGESSLAFTAGTMSAGAMLLIAYSWPGLRALDWQAMPPIVWITLAYITVAATAISTWLMQFAVMRLPASKVMAYTWLVPGWVVLWDMALGGAVPDWHILPGLAVILLALGLLIKDGKKA